MRLHACRSAPGRYDDHEHRISASERHPELVRSEHPRNHTQSVLAIFRDSTPWISTAISILTIFRHRPSAITSYDTLFPPRLSLSIYLALFPTLYPHVFYSYFSPAQAPHPFPSHTPTLCFPPVDLSQQPTTCTMVTSSPSPDALLSRLVSAYSRFPFILLAFPEFRKKHLQPDGRRFPKRLVSRPPRDRKHFGWRRQLSFGVADPPRDSAPTIATPERSWSATSHGWACTYRGRRARG